jgi:hypothetical protein
MHVSDEQPQRDDGIAVHYSTVAPGTSIYASDGVVVGKVVRVLDNAREHILDGFVFEDPQGATKFVDAPEVQRTFERAVELNIDSAAASRLGPPESTGVTESVKNSKLGRLFGR